MWFGTKSTRHFKSQPKKKKKRLKRDAYHETTLHGEKSDGEKARKLPLGGRLKNASFGDCKLFGIWSHWFFKRQDDWHAQGETRYRRLIWVVFSFSIFYLLYICNFFSINWMGFSFSFFLFALYMFFFLLLYNLTK